jgi:glycosyltransferase involved in cell wall biosynthesis
MSAMRVLVVSQYYPPEPGAAQNRISAFVAGLLGCGHQVTVVCEQPNHPVGVFHDGYGRRPLVSEHDGSLTIHRLWVATSPRKTSRRRLAFYGSFAVGALAAVRLVPRHDVAFVTSPPLPGVVAAAGGLIGRHVPYVLDVRDLWPAAAAALGELSNPRVIRQVERAERWLYRHAAAATATTRPFCRHIDRLAGRQIASHLPNGALDQLIEGPSTPPPASGLFTVGYAGNLGIAQGLGIVLDAAAELRGEDIRFRLVGDGPVGATLRSEIERRDLNAIEMRPVVSVEEVGNVLRGCNALLVPLAANRMLEDFVPSKLYDAMAVGRPVIAALGGEAANIVREAQCGMVIASEDGSALAAAARRLRDRPDLVDILGRAGRRAAKEHARSRQVTRLEHVLHCAAERRPPEQAR